MAIIHLKKKKNAIFLNLPNWVINIKSMKPLIKSLDKMKCMIIYTTFQPWMKPKNTLVRFLTILLNDINRREEKTYFTN